MKRVAIIPARGGSKRLPRKNILPVLGRPMLHYPVSAAQESGVFDRVIVSTEDDEIKAVAQKSGAVVYGRSNHLSSDSASVAMVCLDLLERLKSEGAEPDLFCCLYATAIFVTPDDIRSSLKAMTGTAGAQVVMGVSDFNIQPVQALKSDQDGWLRYQWQEFEGLKSQACPDLTASNGTLYWADTTAFIEQKTFYPEKLLGYKLPWMRAIDVDTPADYENARLLAPLFLTKE